MRKAFDGLSTIVSGQLNLTLLDGAVFVFCNKRKNQLKILYWDGTGLCLYAKRLSKGTFAWPSSEKQKIAYSDLELRALLEGIDLSKPVQRKNWQR